jgi:hypothetical protein
MNMTTPEKVLIHENLADQARIRQDIEARLLILNQLQGLEKDEITLNTASQEAIEKHIHKRLLQENELFRKLNDSGIEGTKATLSPELTKLRFSLEAWRAVKMPFRGQDKFESLVFENGSWKVDEDQLERLFEAQKIKVYASGKQLEKFRKAEEMIELFKFFNIPWNHLTTPILGKIINANGYGISPRWQYFQE